MGPYPKITSRGIKETVLNFYTPMTSDMNHRYKSWEHCYSYFGRPINKIDCEYASLHLAFYLASWGMYRGSSGLLQKDYLIHQKVVKQIIAYKHLAGINFIHNKVDAIQEVFKLIEIVRDIYQKEIREVKVGKRKKPFVVTDTLVTKILLGTLGCTPAYDQYFIKGMRLEGISYSILSVSNFKKVVDFYLDNKDEINKAGQEILNLSGITYPPMKLVDMYFWSLGSPNNLAY